MVWSRLQIESQNKKNNAISKGEKKRDVNTVFSRRGKMKDHAIPTDSRRFIEVFFGFFRGYAFLNHWGASLCVVRERIYILQIVVTWNLAPAFQFSLRKVLIPSPKQKLLFESFCCFQFPLPDSKTYIERNYYIVYIFAWHTQCFIISTFKMMRPSGMT